MCLTSPFELDGPVPPSRLVGRRAESETVRAQVLAGQPVALVAPRRFGKTSLIRSVAAEGEREDLTVIVADMFEVASVADLVLRLERAWALQTPPRLRPSVSKILAAAQVGVSIAGSGYALTLADRLNIDPEPALHALLDLPSQLAEREHGRFLIALDDFESVHEVQGACDLVRSHVRCNGGATSYLFSGTDFRLVAAMFDANHPLEDQVSILRLGRLPVGGLSEAIGQRFAAGGRDVTDVLDALVAAGEGHPQRTMLLAHLLWRDVAAGERISNEHLEDVIATALRFIDPEARAILGGLTVGQRKVLRAVAEYGTPMAARARRVLGLPKTTAQKAAPHLAAMGFIEETDREWRLVDPLLARWIRARYGTRGGYAA
ncbi:hypothetical protein ACW9HR_34855 [Nocardia gipuzkoensis]